MYILTQFAGYAYEPEHSLNDGRRGGFPGFSAVGPRIFFVIDRPPGWCCNGAADRPKSNDRGTTMTNKTITTRLALAFAAFVVAPALAQSSGKNPADACKGMDKASKAYSDCVKAQAQANKPAATSAQNTKKPGQTCGGMDKASKAYSDCVKAQAQTTKDAKQATGAAQGQGKPAKN
jgi:hypothetical protein